MSIVAHGPLVSFSISFLVKINIVNQHIILRCCISWPRVLGKMINLNDTCIFLKRFTENITCIWIKLEQRWILRFKYFTGLKIFHRLQNLVRQIYENFINLFLVGVKDLCEHNFSDFNDFSVSLWLTVNDMSLNDMKLRILALIY